MGALLTPDDISFGRMGQLLATSRLESEVDLEVLAMRSSFTVGELSDIEAGHSLLRADQMTEVASLYETDCGLVVPTRHPLRIDLVAGSISADGHSISLDSMDDDHVLDQYLSLVYRMRNREPGTSLHLRDEDVEILASSLTEREDFAVERLHDAMGVATRSNRRFPGLHRYLRLGAAPSILGLLSIRAVLLSSPDMAEVSMMEPEPEPESDLDPETSTTPSLRERIVVRAPAPTSSPLPETDADSNVVVELPEWPVWGTGVITQPWQPISVDDPQSVEELIEVADAADAAETGEAPPVAEVIEVVQAPVATVVEQVASPADTRSELGQRAEALLRQPLAEAIPGWTVEYLEERPGHRGMTLWETRRIEIYVRPSDNATSLASILAHEVGHAVDVSRLEDADRHGWLAARQITGAPWWASSAAPDFHTGAGDFAEAYAVWSVGDRSDSQIAGQPTAAQLALLESYL